jgi:hypothetical protein
MWNRPTSNGLSARARISGRIWESWESIKSPEQRRCTGTGTWTVDRDTGPRRRDDQTIGSNQSGADFCSAQGTIPVRIENGDGHRSTRLGFPESSTRNRADSVMVSPCERVGEIASLPSATIIDLRR